MARFAAFHGDHAGMQPTALPLWLTAGLDLLTSEDAHAFEADRPTVQAHAAPARMATLDRQALVLRIQEAFERASEVAGFQVVTGPQSLLDPHGWKAWVKQVRVEAWGPPPAVRFEEAVTAALRAFGEALCVLHFAAPWRFEDAWRAVPTQVPREGWAAIAARLGGARWWAWRHQQGLEERLIDSTVASRRPTRL